MIENEQLFEPYTTAGRPVRRGANTRSPAGPPAWRARPCRAPGPPLVLLRPARTPWPCSAWPARTGGSVPPGLPRVRPRREDWACPLSHARAAAVPGRRRLLRGRPGVPRWDAQTRAGWAGPPQSASAISRDWRRPRPAGDSGGAPHEPSQVQDLLDPRSSHSPPLPRRINPPEPAGVKAGWRTRGGHVENAPPALRGASRGPPWPLAQLS